MSPDVKNKTARPKPFLRPEYCKGCGRCVAACPKKCISSTGEVNPETGCVPVQINYQECISCGTCFMACPEPYALHPDNIEYFWEVPNGQPQEKLPTAEDIPDRIIPLPNLEPMMIKGTYASAIGALLAGCRHFFGYPITPSTEGAELMAKILPHVEGVFLQAVSEVATINYMYGCGGAGRP